MDFVIRKYATEFNTQIHSLIGHQKKAISVNEIEL